MQPNKAHAIFRQLLQCHPTFGSNTSSFILQYKVLRHWLLNTLFQLLAQNIIETLSSFMRPNYTCSNHLLSPLQSTNKRTGGFGAGRLEEFFFYGELQR